MIEQLFGIATEANDFDDFDEANCRECLIVNGEEMDIYDGTVEGE